MERPARGWGKQRNAGRQVAKITCWLCYLSAANHQDLHGSTPSWAGAGRGLGSGPMRRTRDYTNTIDNKDEGQPVKAARGWGKLGSAGTMLAWWTELHYAQCSRHQRRIAIMKALCIMPSSVHHASILPRTTKIGTVAPRAGRGRAGVLDQARCGGLGVMTTRWLYPAFLVLGCASFCLI